MRLLMHIYEDLNCNPPFGKRGTFVDISKTFDKVWYDGLFLKLQTYGKDGNLLKLLKNWFWGHYCF